MTEMRSEREKMLAGELYNALDPELSAARVRARRMVQRYNALDPAASDEKAALLKDLFAAVGARVGIEPPFFCDYGENISVGDEVFANFNCVFLDCNTITIGSQTQLGPGVQLYTATHPIDAATRVAGPELAHPIVIGRRVWLGGGSVVLPGVTIGDDTVIGAGSVVTKSIPARVVAAGNPCRVLREL
jgi:maltose O-acetyltransferase